MAQLQPMGIKAVAEGVGQFNSKVGSMNKSMDDSNKSMGKSAKAAASLGKIMIGVGVAVGGATAALVGMKKAFDFGREGAVITQTSESFSFLIKKIGASTSLLEELTSASRGTISEMELMTSTATLLAGAGDELARKLADATPQLLEIAKAANKLNPALGTTAFLYESIATGVKRAQPLILDNLGITIKVGEANEAFAKSIGKSVSELTSEEKAMAILNGTLAAGDNLIQQVGGSVDSATDSFDRLGVGITSAGDRLKKAAFTAIEPTVSSMADIFEESNKVNTIMDDFNVKMNGWTGNWEFHGRAIGDTREEVITWAESMERGLAQADMLMAGLGKAPPVLEEIQKALGPVTVDLNLRLRESALESASRRLFQWSQEQQQKLILEAHIKLTTELVEAGGAGLTEFQHGGQFKVGGKPGVDQNLVAFKASRGEVVTVTPTSNVDNRSVNMGDINMGGGGLSPTQFDRMIRNWMGA